MARRLSDMAGTVIFWRSIPVWILAADGITRLGPVSISTGQVIAIRLGIFM